MTRMTIDLDAPPVPSTVGYAKCRVCGRFCKNPRGFYQFTGTWNDFIIMGDCPVHGEQTESTV